MNHQEMQTEALIIESLLGAALAMSAEDDREDCLLMIEKAQARAKRLNEALDIVNLPT